MEFRKLKVLQIRDSMEYEPRCVEKEKVNKMNSLDLDTHRILTQEDNINSGDTSLEM